MDSLTASQDPSGWRQAAADDQAAQIGALKSELESLKESVAAIPPQLVASRAQA